MTWTVVSQSRILSEDLFTFLVCHLFVFISALLMTARVVLQKPRPDQFNKTYEA